MENGNCLFKRNQLAASQNGAPGQVDQNMIFINKSDIVNLMQTPVPITSLTCAARLNYSRREKEIKLAY